MNHGIVAPLTLEDKGEQENQRRRDDGLDTELRSKNPCADEQQGDIHADGIKRNLPGPQRVEHVGEAVGTARCHQIGVHKHHITDSKQQATDGEQSVCQYFLPQFSLWINLNHILFC